MMRKFSSDAKIIPFSELAAWREKLSHRERPLVVTNGCFDLLHSGHVRMLEEARCAGASLLVGITCDREVCRLKGQGRPILGEGERATLIAALECVIAVTIFREADACAFLDAARPDVYFKGGDYTIESINQEERRILESLGSEIRFAHLVPGASSRSLISHIQAMEKPSGLDACRERHKSLLSNFEVPSSIKNIRDESR